MRAAEHGQTRHRPGERPRTPSLHIFNASAVSVWDEMLTCGPPRRVRDGHSALALNSGTRRLRKAGELGDRFSMSCQVVEPAGPSCTWGAGQTRSWLHCIREVRTKPPKYTAAEGTDLVAPHTSHHFRGDTHSFLTLGNVQQEADLTTWGCIGPTATPTARGTRDPPPTPQEPQRAGLSLRPQDPGRGAWGRTPGATCAVTCKNAPKGFASGAGRWRGRGVVRAGDTEAPPGQAEVPIKVPEHEELPPSCE